MTRISKKWREWREAMKARRRHYIAAEALARACQGLVNWVEEYGTVGARNEAERGYHLGQPHREYAAWTREPLPCPTVDECLKLPDDVLAKADAITGRLGFCIGEVASDWWTGNRWHVKESEETARLYEELRQLLGPGTMSINGSAALLTPYQLATMR